jgi:hypothetical protein
MYKNYNCVKTWNILEEYDMYVRFQVLTAASVKMDVFWLVAPYSLSEVYLRFRGVRCLHSSP